MTLTEFLLARIAEDEHTVIGHLKDRDIPKHQWPWIDTDGPMWDDEYFALHIGAGRVLAECAAKRRIVALADSWKPDAPQREIGWNDAIDQALVALAQPYADHPDFDPDWRL